MHSYLANIFKTFVHSLTTVLRFSRNHRKKLEKLNAGTKNTVRPFKAGTVKKALQISYYHLFSFLNT